MKSPISILLLSFVLLAKVTFGFYGPEANFEFSKTKVFTHKSQSISVGEERLIIDETEPEKTGEEETDNLDSALSVIHYFYLKATSRTKLTASIYQSTVGLCDVAIYLKDRNFRL
jgi:hypothetical protein